MSSKTWLQTESGANRRSARGHKLCSSKADEAYFIRPRNANTSQVNVCLPSANKSASSNLGTGPCNTAVLHDDTMTWTNQLGRPARFPPFLHIARLPDIRQALTGNLFQRRSSCARLPDRYLFSTSADRWHGEQHSSPSSPGLIWDTMRLIWHHRPRAAPP